MATGAYWGEERHRELWVRVVDRLGNRASFGNYHGGTFYETWTDLYRYPAMLAFFAAGLAATARGKSAEETLTDLLLLPRIKFRLDDASESPSQGLYAANLLRHDLAQRVLHERAYTPLSDHLHLVLQPVIRSLVGDEAAYAALFDRWEYLIALAYSDQGGVEPGERRYIPVGRLLWRREATGGRPSVTEAVKAEVQREGINWLLLRRGLFGGAPARLSAIQTTIDEAIARRGAW
jgi:hypothetical protein